MKINSMNEGNKILYTVTGTTITIGIDQPVTIDLATREKDFSVTIDISRDDSGNLVEGLAKYYDANIIIPGRQYKNVKVPSNEINGTPIEVTQRQPVPLNMNRVILQLWALPG